MCSGRRWRVVSLKGMELQGTISPFLEYSTLGISFFGRIPYQLGNLFRFKLLHLYINQFQGSIPPTIGECRSLQILSMAV